MSNTKIVQEVYTLGRDAFKNDPIWETLPKYKELNLADLDKVFKLLMDLLSIVGISDGEVNKKGLSIEDCIDLVNRRRFELQKSKMG